MYVKILYVYVLWWIIELWVINVILVNLNIYKNKKGLCMLDMLVVVYYKLYVNI